MGKCEICGKEGVSLLSAYFKDLNRMVKICQDCWRNAYVRNLLLSGSGGSGGSGGCCG